MRMVGAPDQPGSGTAGDPTHALFADQSHSFPDNLVALFGRIRAWNYSAETARSAVGCSPRSGSETVASQAEHCCHPASRSRSFSSARSSSGSPLLEVNLPRRRRGGTAGDDPKETMDDRQKLGFQYIARSGELKMRNRSVAWSAAAPDFW